MKFKTLEFRPTPNFFKRRPYRYANGLWIEDDGEYDVAFISGKRPLDDAPYCLGISIPYHKNILCTWSGCYVAPARDSRRQRIYGFDQGYHRYLKDGKDWGDHDIVDFSTRDKQLNEIAMRSGMNKCCSMHGCANGRHIDFYADNITIALGLVRYRDTKEIFSWPDDMECSYCHIPATETIKEAVKRGKIELEKENMRKLAEVETKLDGGKRVA